MFSSASSSSGAASSTAPTSTKGALLLEVRQLGNASHPLTVAISQLKGMGVAEDWIGRFVFPVQLVGAKNLRELKTKVLTEEDPLFLSIHQLMREARNKLMPQLSNQDPLQKIFQVYENFMREVCAAQGKERSRLLKGEILLEGHEVGQLFISQEMGRTITSYGKYGEMVRSNTLGSSAVQKVGGIYYKRERFNPLAPGNELLFNSLSSFFSDRG